MVNSVAYRVYIHHIFLFVCGYTGFSSKDFLKMNEWPKEIEWPTPIEEIEMAIKKKEADAAWKIEWQRRLQLEEVWLDYSTHYGDLYDFHWECPNCNHYNEESDSDIEDMVYTSILQCSKCNAEFRIIDPR